MRIASGAVALIAAGLVGFSTSGHAEGPQGPWSGFYLGIAFGIGDVDSDVHSSATRTTKTWDTCETITNGTGGNGPGICTGEVGTNNFFPADINGVVGVESAPFNPATTIVDQLNNLTSGEVSWLGMVIVGVDQKIGQSLVVGAFADLSVTDAEASFSTTGPIASISGKLDFDYLATVGGRLGWIVPNGNGLLYVYGGYTHAGADDAGATVTTGQGSTAVKFDDFQGFSVGGGGEAQLGGGWFARVEYRFTSLDGKSFGFSHVGGKIKTPEPGGSFQQCAGTAGPGLGPRNLDCVRFNNSQTTTSGSAEIDSEIHSVRMALGYRF